MRLQVVAVCALMSAMHVLAQSSQPDVWVCVLTYDASNGEITAVPGVMVRPVAALVGGTWRGERENGSEQLEGTPDGFARWPPAGTLPRSWTAWLVDGRRERFQISGPPRSTGVFDMPGVAASVRAPRPPRDAWSDDILGVAVSGDAVVRRFVDVQGGDRGRMSDVMRLAMVDAEVKEIAARTPAATVCGRAWRSSNVPRRRRASLARGAI